MARWNLNIPEETDRAVRTLLARKGGRKGDLTKFVVEAVQRALLRETVADTRRRFADLTADEADRLAEDALAWARADRD